MKLKYIVCFMWLASYIYLIYQKIMTLLTHDRTIGWWIDLLIVMLFFTSMILLAIAQYIRYKRSKSKKIT